MKNKIIITDETILPFLRSYNSFYFTYKWSISSSYGVFSLLLFVFPIISYLLERLVCCSY